jgi:hypothetical protein
MLARPRIQWVQSFVTDDQTDCVYIAPDETAVRTHAERGGFPANRTARVRAAIYPNYGRSCGVNAGLAGAWWPLRGHTRGEKLFAQNSEGES